MNVALVKPTAEFQPDDLFAAARSRLPGSGAVADARRNAFDAFAAQGLPNRRVEQWKYTDLRVLLREIAPLAPAPDHKALARAETAVRGLAVQGAATLVLVDGTFAPNLSDLKTLESGVRFRALREMLENGDSADLLCSDAPSDAMLSLNAAMATDGVVIEVADGTALTHPLHVVHVTTGSATAAFVRSRIAIGNGARAMVVESFVAAEGAANYQVHNAVTLSVGDDAEVEHVRLMDDARDAANISTGVVTLGAKARYNLLNFTSGGAVSRYQSFIKFDGENTHAEINGVNLLNGRQHADTTLVLDHAVPNCASREVFRAVLDDRAHSVFQGRIIVQPHAQKTDAKMMTRALLLSDEAEADNKPELEIFADDVTCGHGATTGALDESLLFYLRARGLSEKEAQALLIQAFVGEAIETIADETLRDAVIAQAERWLATRG